MNDFTSEDQRYEYQLDPSDFVFDIGAFRGAWAQEIFRRYGCRIICFEPIFYREIALTNPKVTIFPFAVGGRTRAAEFGVSNDSTGLFSVSGERLLVPVLDVEEILTIYDGCKIGLIKMNCEGMEYEILRRLVEIEDINRVRNIQVQFHHTGPDAATERAGIHSQLARTHQLTYCKPFVWENWELKL